ncbi:MAG: hypothetical protein AB1556_11780 [Bacillota bacterium]
MGVSPDGKKKRELFWVPVSQGAVKEAEYFPDSGLIIIRTGEWSHCWDSGSPPRGDEFFFCLGREQLNEQKIPALRKYIGFMAPAR